MKKRLITILCMMFCLNLCACGSNESVTEPFNEEEQTVSEENTKDPKTLIFDSENIQSALKQYKELVESAETEEIKQEIGTYMSEYFLEDLNGYFYFLNPEHKEMHVDSDTRAIYIKNKDEVYVLPYSEQEMQEKQLELEDFPQLENSELYKYHISEIESGVRTLFNYATNTEEIYYFTRVLLVSDYFAEEETTRLNSVDIECVYNAEQVVRYNTSGYFADENDLIPEYDREHNYGAIRTYYRDEDTALSGKINQDKKDEDWMTEQGWIEGEKAEPAIGMTEDEVLNSTWGSPDRKNIDEYEWGTNEQWVYDNLGYIYFKDGVVTSISKQE